MTHTLGRVDLRPEIPRRSDKNKHHGKKAEHESNQHGPGFAVDFEFASAHPHRTDERGEKREGKKRDDGLHT